VRFFVVVAAMNVCVVVGGGDAVGDNERRWQRQSVLGMPQRARLLFSVHNSTSSAGFLGTFCFAVDVAVVIVVRS
jgi:hypothetical protein